MSADYFQQYWMTIFAIFAAVWYFFGVMAYRVQEDAKKRGLSRTAVTFWSVSIVFFGPIFLPLYFIFRSNAIFTAKEGETPLNIKYILCPHCGESNTSERTSCAKCNKQLDEGIPAVGTKACPYCGAENSVDAGRCVSCDQVIGYGRADNDEDE